MGILKDSRPLLVGGAVRDALTPNLRRRSRDLDIIVRIGSLEEAAEKLIQRLGGTIVRLKYEQTLRIVLPDGMILDLSSIIGGSLEEDLGRRDFTINSMCWSSNEGLIDIHDGVGDVLEGRIRSISEPNLADDPVRVLRAYRFAAECGFEIHRQTRTQLKRNAGLLRNPPGERITEELIKLLNIMTPIKALEMAHSDGILAVILGTHGAHIGNNIKLIKRLPMMTGDANFGLSRSGLLRLEALMVGVQLHGSKLVLSTYAKRRIECFNKAYSRRMPGVRTKELYALFESAGKSADDLLLATGRHDLRCELLRFSRIHRSPLIETAEVMRISGLGQGKSLGKLLGEIRLQRFLGAIKSNKDCVLYIKHKQSV